jgi:hypothetical protein
LDGITLSHLFHRQGSRFGIDMLTIGTVIPLGAMLTLARAGIGNYKFNLP